MKVIYDVPLLKNVKKKRNIQVLTTRQNKSLKYSGNLYPSVWFQKNKPKKQQQQQHLTLEKLQKRNKRVIY